MRLHDPMLAAWQISARFRIATTVDAPDDDTAGRVAEARNRLGKIFSIVGLQLRSITIVP
jgi:hypothetical protein